MEARLGVLLKRLGDRFTLAVRVTREEDASGVFRGLADFVEAIDEVA